MPVSAQETVFHHVGNGITVTFAYGCQILKATDLKVYLNDELLNSGYAVNGVGALTGGTVTFVAAPANQAKVRLERDIALERVTDYQQNGDFLARVVNPDFNRIWMALQQYQTAQRNTLRASNSDAVAPAPLPTIDRRADKLLGFDADGHPIAVVPSAQSAAAVLLELSKSEGASLVSFRDRSVDDKLQESVSILDYGGSLDGVTDNTTALQAMRDDGRLAVRFPFVPGTPNKYFFSGALTTSLTDGGSFDVDAGVVISILDIGYLSSTLRFVRDTELQLSALKCKYSVGTSTNRIPSSRPYVPSYTDRDISSLWPISCNADLAFKKVTYNTDAFATFAPTAVSASSVTFGTASGNDYLAGFKKLKPGEEMSAQFVGATAGASPLVLVRTATSYYGLVVGTGDTAQPTLFSKASGAAPMASNISYMGMGTHASYAGYKSLWTIRLNAINDLSILFNGVEVQQIITNDEILETGFGVQGGAGDSIQVQDWTWAKSRQQAGKKSISIAVFGDSISDGALYGNWPSQLASILDQHYGLRVLYLDNYANSGDNSAAQMALCTPANVARADVVIIMLGVNDIQGGVTEATYSANLTAMINTCKAAGKRVVVGTPTMFYGQGQAGVGVGQATTNYDQGRGIRAKCMSVSAGLGVKHVDTLGLLGPVLADRVNPPLNSVADLGRDPVVFDNIHPTLLGRMVLARGFAAAIAGQITPQATLSTSLASLPAGNLANGWTFTNQPGKWIRDDTGIVSLSGIVDRGAAIADGTVIYTLPENLRPLNTGRFVAWCDAAIAKILIDGASGQISIFGFPAGGTWVSLDNICFPTK